MYLMTKYSYFGNTHRGQLCVVQGYDCKREMLWVRFPLEEMKYLINIYITLLWCPGKVQLNPQYLQNLESPEPGKCGVECLGTRLFLSTLLHVGLSSAEKKREKEPMYPTVTKRKILYTVCLV